MQFFALLCRMYVNVTISLAGGYQVAIGTEPGSEHVLRGISDRIFGRNSRLELRRCLMMMMRVHLI